MNRRNRSNTPFDVLRSIAFYAAFYLGSIGFVIMTSVLAPVSRPAFRVVVRGWSAYHRLCARWLLGIRVACEGFVPRTGVLYAVKHQSFFEAIDLPRQYRLPVVFAKMELLSIPLWGAAGRRYGLIGVEREAGAKALRSMLKQARELVADGRPLVIFPEGTRVPVGQQPPLQAGFAGIYKLLGLPVIPVAVDSGRLYHRRWKHAGTVHYRFGEEIPPGLPRAEIEARVHAAINALNGPGDGPT
ncbi:1-acyl-sn-glycerol-3-phosphate acyltransferase [Novosphingobium sp. KCTC 2891]|uniref:lysophospholipid acyltransferase family protein n=1 Tax=Novosphingobium sp. KCTC 2891 TaxID=2989730 RepID=UPI0022215BEF|nr:lysophospholipid acyltransferase family protein [Novosphingobium sp. KCTC 2891]MCW1383049.1 1-acyl-sn-glycerol-3-phosphate acyltransferase [Novosphingobium sp. KCTC 2891]